MSETKTYRCPRCNGPAYLDVINLKCDACRTIVAAVSLIEKEEPKKPAETPAYSSASHYS